jgi:hypothetical protein
MKRIRINQDLLVSGPEKTFRAVVQKHKLYLAPVLIGLKIIWISNYASFW